MKKTTTSKGSLGLRKERVRSLTPKDMLMNVRGGMLPDSCCPGTEKCGPFTKPPV